jgi:hypothetical protein
MVVGQAFMIGHLATFVKLFDLLFYGRRVGGASLLLLSLYLVAYIAFLAIYLKMGADGYDSQVRMIKYFYCLTPVILAVLSLFVSLWPELSKSNPS